MKEALHHDETTQRPRLPPTGPGNHRPDGPKAGHAPTLKPDHSAGSIRSAEILARINAGYLGEEVKERISAMDAQKEVAAE